MSNLTIVQHSFRYFSYSQALVATIMILGALWLRLTTGWYAASFLFFVFGLTCVYMSFTCMIAWKRCFLEENADPALGKRRRKSMMVYVVLGGLVWAFFGYVVIGSDVDRIYVNEFGIRRTPQFDRELQRFIIDAKESGYDAIEKYTDSKLVIQGYSAGAISTLRMFEHYYKQNTNNSHVHTVNIGSKAYKMTLLSHRSHYGWLDYETGGAMNQYIAKYCQFFVPFTAERMDGTTISNMIFNGMKLEFLEQTKLNTLNITLFNGELIISDFIPQGSDNTENCRDGALEYTTTNKRTALGAQSLDSAPVELLRYLAFPGFNDGVLSINLYRKWVFGNDFSRYIRRVERASRSIFD